MSASCVLTQSEYDDAYEGGESRVEYGWTELSHFLARLCRNSGLNIEQFSKAYQSATSLEGLNLNWRSPGRPAEDARRAKQEIAIRFVAEREALLSVIGPASRQSRIRSFQKVAIPVANLPCS
jgi:hypothetical protein